MKSKQLKHPSIWKHVSTGQLFIMKSFSIYRKFNSSSFTAHIVLLPHEGVQYTVVMSWPVFFKRYKQFQAQEHQCTDDIDSRLAPESRHQFDERQCANF